MPPTPVCLVGAGSIAQVHAQALRSLPGCTLAAVVDPNLAAAQRLAATFGDAGTRVFASVAEALAAQSEGGGFTRAHVLVPPDLHAEAARPLLAAGVAVLLEKPLAADGTQCAALLDAAAAGGALLGVNQNFVHHPAFARLRALVESGAYGLPRFVGGVYHSVVRQMAARQFGHWMFQAPVNILLEQAVHPLSQILTLAGPVDQVRALAGPAMEIAPGVGFTPSVDVVLGCARVPAQLRFAVGVAFPFWQITVVCDDGVVVADILANRVHVLGRTRFLEAADAAASGLRLAGGIAADSLRNFATYAMAMLRLRGRSDPFYLSMRASIAAFHAALDAGRPPPLDGRFGADLVEVCETIRDQAFAAPAAQEIAAPPVSDTPLDVPCPVSCDVALLGGTGFIGVYTLRRLLDAGQRVAVMARSLRNLPSVFHDPRVVLHQGDINDAAAVARAIAGAGVVVNLAHGGGGASFAQIRAAMVGGAEIVARACQQAGVRRLVHVGSIAALYLGPQPGPVTGATPPDPQEARRADYARAKVLADRMLLDLHAREGLPVVILRPGIVVGAGGPPFHSGIGFYNTDQHCIGWGDGRAPLPFVLVDDTAAAIVAACTAPGIDGRCYNLVGDVRLTARDYVSELGRALGRPLRFHPQSPVQLWLEDMAKWLVKRLGGRAAPRPDLRDFRSRAMTATFDCADATRDLGWHPVAERAVFVSQAIDVQAQP